MNNKIKSVYFAVFAVLHFGLHDIYRGLWHSLDEFHIVLYYKLAKREEEDILKKFPEEYKQYIIETPMFILKVNFNFEKIRQI